MVRAVRPGETERAVRQAVTERAESREAIVAMARPGVMAEVVLREAIAVVVWPRETAWMGGQRGRRIGFLAQEIA